MASIADTTAIEALTKALKDSYGGVRHSAARALGNIGGERSVSALRGALQRCVAPDVDFENILEPLIRLRDPQVVDLALAMDFHSFSSWLMDTLLKTDDPRLVGRLVRYARRTGRTRCEVAVKKIQDLLKSAPSKIDTEDLYIIATIPNISTKETEQFQGESVVMDVTVDCEVVRCLAV